MLSFHANSSGRCVEIKKHIIMFFVNLEITSSMPTDESFQYLMCSGQNRINVLIQLIFFISNFHSFFSAYLSSFNCM